MIDHDDLNWLKSEINTIKDGIREIVELLGKVDD